uniref:Uncharacterized protein n=1 Tax=Arundo donax TaxID=35708 RepID=A0A0A8ZN20_ARUDO
MFRSSTMPRPPLPSFLPQDRCRTLFQGMSWGRSRYPRTRRTNHPRRAAAVRNTARCHPSISKWK